MISSYLINYHRLWKTADYEEDHQLDTRINQSKSSSFIDKLSKYRSILNDKARSFNEIINDQSTSVLSHVSQAI